ncbi:MAG: ATP-binding cassette domain-containing protein [Oscillospiraceae bacterium]|nr:ATP-binding cassette domain-containing protein [Oscillospiraceae bacterium]
MDTFTITDLTFSYPEQEKKALHKISISIPQGEFLTLCGPSGCGKSTLLRQLKTVLSPHGTRSGEILFEGTPLGTLDQRTQAAQIGYVLQSPDNQIVTDKVWHELAFGLESLGYDTPTIRRRVAEMASFFGIEAWFHKNVTELSGGQKQLLNLASIMAMQPSVLILDEPTSQLDPIAAADFIATIGKINRELGTTIILTEHRLEDVFPLATRVLVMDAGAVICAGSPNDVGLALRARSHAMFLAMPTAMRIWAAVPNDLACPITVRDGRRWLGAYAAAHPLGAVPRRGRNASGDHGTAVTLEEVWFKYEKELPDVAKGLSIEVRRGELLAILGGNGAGKTTALSLISGRNKPYRGTVTVCGTVGILPQNPQAVFVKKTVREDLFEMLKQMRITQAEKDAKAAHVTQLCRLEALLDRHPYDLSGGEQQRAALAKILLLDPEILLLDEPTKGLDAAYKQVFAQILRILLRRGVSIIMVSHDVEFCAQYAHRCALFFDGSIAAEAAPGDFFSGNSFYTTAANRMARGYLPAAILTEDVVTACGGTVPPEPTLPDDIPPLPPPDAHSTAAKPQKLPLWRKILAGVFGIAAIVAFVVTIRISDLSALITQEGVTGTGYQTTAVQVVFIISALIFALAIGRRAPAPLGAVQVPRGERRLSRRTVAAAVIILLLVPLTLFIGVFYLDHKKYYFIALLMMLEIMLPFALLFEGRKPQARELVIIAVLCAIAIAGRAAFFALPNFKPVMAIVIIAGIAFGGETGFLVGAVTMLVSNMMFSQGPWTPFQMFAMGIIGFLAGVLFRKGLLRRTRMSMCIFGAICAVVIYGGIMNPASALIWARELNWRLLLTYYISGFPMDLIQALATFFFLYVAGEPMLEKLDRVKVKYGLVQ